MAESIDNIISEGAFEQLKRLLKEITDCDGRMQEFIKTVDTLRRSLESAGGIKAVGTEYNKLMAATEKLNAATREKIDLEEKAGRECTAIAKYIGDTTKKMRDESAAQSERKTKMQETVDTMIDQQMKLQDVGKELKEAKAQYKEAGEGAGALKDRINALTIEEATLKESIAEGSKEFKNMVTEGRNDETSLKAKAAALANLKSEYETLSESERNNASIGGDLKARMNELSAELKSAKESTAGYSMKVGDTEISVGRLRMKFREMVEQIQAQTFVFSELGDAIAAQNGKVAQAAQIHGTSSAEYRKEAEQLENLKRAHLEAGEEIERMRQQAGKLQDIIGDTTDAVKAWSSDTANVDALVTGMDTMVQGYTAVKASMAAVGVESEELMNVFAKVQLLQQGVNAVQKIANNLTKESVFKSKLKVVWEKMRLAMTEAQVKATTKETVAETANTAATAANTKAQQGNTTALAANNAGTTTAIATTGGLAVAETAATATTFTLAGALKAVGVAIKSIPVIGWILAAVAALAALGKLVHDMLTKEKELTREQKFRGEIMKRNNEIQAAAMETVAKEKNQLDTNILRMRELKKDTEEWKDAVQKVADQLGVSSEWLKENKDRVDELADAWYNCKLQQTLADKYAEESANAAIEAEKKIMAVTGDRKSREEAIDAIDALSEAEKKRWKCAEHLVRAGNAKEKQEAKATIDYMKRRTREYADEISGTFTAKAKSAANVAATYSAELEKAKKSSDKKTELASAGATAYKERVKFAAETAKKFAELEAKTDREIYDLKQKNLKEQFDKDIKQYGKNARLKADIERRYELESGQLQEEYLKKRNDRIAAANKESASLLMTLNEERIKNTGISEEQLTEMLIANERTRNQTVLEENRRSFEKEVENLEEGSAEYLAIKQKWDARNEKQAYDSMEREKAIRKKGFDDILADISRKTKDDDNRLTVTAADGGMSDYDIQQERQRIKIEGIQAEIDKYRELEATYAELGMTEEEYTSKMLELEARLATERKSQHEQTMAQLAAQREARQELALTIGDSISAIGNAIAQSVEDEKQKVVIQQSLAMAQVMLEQAVAISKAVSSATEGDPYTIAIRIAAAVGAVVASFISAKNAISAAGQSVAQANAYAEGTDYHKGGSAIVGEGFKPELVITGKKSFVVDRPTFFKNLPIGSKVIPLEDGMMPNLGNMADIDLSEVLQSLGEIKSRPMVRIDVGENVYSHIVKGASQTRILNSQFSH